VKTALFGNESQLFSTFPEKIRNYHREVLFLGTLWFLNSALQKSHKARERQSAIQLPRSTNCSQLAEFLDRIKEKIALSIVRGKQNYGENGFNYAGIGNPSP
jgi:hypothetical protein